MRSLYDFLFKNISHHGSFQGFPAPELYVDGWMDGSGSGIGLDGISVRGLNCNMDDHHRIGAKTNDSPASTITPMDGGNPQSGTLCESLSSERDISKLLMH